MNAIIAKIAIIIITPNQIPVLKTSPIKSHPEKIVIDDSNRINKDKCGFIFLFPFLICSLKRILQLNVN